MSKYTPDQITFWMDNFTSVSEGYEERETRLYNVGVVRGLIAELTRLRTANAALRAECVARRALWEQVHMSVIYKGSTDEVDRLAAITDTTPGAMEDANG